MIIQRFQQQVKKYAGKIAVRTGNGSLTYKELDTFSNRIANKIRAAGESSGNIGLLADDAGAMIASILGVLKAGNTYVPLVKDFPAKRLQYIIQHAEIDVLITDNKNKDGLLKAVDNKNVRFILLEDLEKENNEDGLAFQRDICADSDAYILYTSGSTGFPKGVRQTHRNIVFFIDRYTENLALTCEDNLTLFSSFSHDASIMDIYSALLNGAALFPLDLKTEGIFSKLPRWLRKERISVWHSVPTVYRYFIAGFKGENSGKADFPPLRYIVLGGEAVLKHDIEGFYSLFRKGGRCRLYNLYGQTESTYNSGQFYEAGGAGISITLGETVKGTEIFVVDEEGDEVEALEVGEIIIVGGHVSPGYWKDEESSREKFAVDGEERIYFTGDLGRRLSGGGVEFLGRKDNQVKLRGFRIELAEIESAVMQYNYIDQAAVIPVESVSRDSQEIFLACYFAADRDIDMQGLREYLGERLLDYMIPAYFRQLEKLPVTVSGKIDRKALPVPDVTVGKEYVPPGTALEKQLVEIWAGVLDIGREVIGIDSNFFQLGGHSLRAAVLTAKIHKELRVKVPLSVVFDKPTIKGLRKYIQQCGESLYIGINPVEKREYYPLSSAQRQLYFVQQLDTGGTGYNIPYLFVLGPDADSEKLENTFNQLIQRHEILRTSFHIVDQKPVQKVHDPDTVNQGGSFRENRPPGPPTKAFNEAFDLSVPPLMRAELLREEDNNGVCYSLVVEFHHIITDNISLNLLEAEFMALYNGKQLPELMVQYKDYTQWQNSGRQKAALKWQGDYWLGLFKGKGQLPVLELPYDYPRPAVQSFEGKAGLFVLGKEETKGLKEMAKTFAATLYMVLIAVFNLLLSRLGGGEEIIVGAPAVTRGQAELHDMIGMFVNTLPLWNNLPGAKPFADFLKDVKQTTLAAFENREYPFDELVENISAQIPRNTGRNPVFDVLFNLLDERHFKGEDLEINELQSYELLRSGSRLDLSLTAGDRGEKIVFRYEYSTRLFKETSMQRFIDCFKRIILDVIASPGKPIFAVEILPEEEKHQVLYAFNDTTTGYPEAKTVHGLFTEQAAKNPDGIAVIAQGAGRRAISYRELNEKSYELARLLKEKGVRPDTIVGIMMGRSIDMIIGIFGILKAGGAYLPLDPGYPEERIQYMLADSSAGILVSKANDAVEVKCMHDPPPLEGGGPKGRGVLVYVIYTSGTTGRPRGVMIEHRGMVNLRTFHRAYFNIAENDRVVQFAPSSFDASAWEIFMALLNGAALYLLDRETIGNYRVFEKYLNTHAITIATLPPEYAGHLDPGKVGCLRFLITAGSAPPIELVNRWKNKAAYVNAYGPTEASICAAAERIAENENGGDEMLTRVPIGKPLSNTYIYITDAYLKPRPVGVPGELCISGAGVGRGYVNRPELTNETFIANPFAAGERLYRSGDLARWLPGGKIEFLGRIDRQVKVRGFRIEPAEVENRLLSHEHINAAAVIVTGTGDLCAYFVSEKDLEASVLKEYLSRQLPYYMVPSFFIKIDKIPLTPSGKVDGNVLAAKGAGLKKGVEYTAPVGDLEIMIAEIWKEVLGVDRVGTDENFFDIGGNSLKAIQLNSRLNELLDQEISIADLFEHVTIRSFVDSYKSFCGRWRAPRRGEPIYGGSVGLNLKQSSQISAVSSELKQRAPLPAGGNEIAIIGMAGRFPGAKDIDEFWDNLKKGIESVSFLSDGELERAGIDSRLPGGPGYVKAAGGVIEGKEFFDASFFDYTPREAETMAPQVRMFHGCVWGALENAGYDPYAYGGLIGIYAGASSTALWETFTLVESELDETGQFAAVQLSDKDFLTTRLAYTFNLKGPAVTVHTACSTSLAAVHMAGRAVVTGECDMALAGGVKVAVQPAAGYVYREGMIASPDGHCRAFDHRAKGTVMGEGAGVVLLKSLEDALAAKDHIHAVIKGTALDNDGFYKAGYAAPGRGGQTAVIRAALRAAGVDPASIGYIETHGTGTTIGDPIEMEALKKAFHSDKKGFCAVGSVKTNIGHLDTAAGVAGLIKAVLALKYRFIPPSLHYEKANPKIDFANSPFYVNTVLKEWQRTGGPLRAGVSSFGIGGTNVHAILEEGPELQGAGRRAQGAGREYQLILLSAKTKTALDKLAGNLVSYLKHNPGIALADAAYTLQVGRKRFKHRRMVLVKTPAEVIRHLSSPLSEKVGEYTAREDSREVVFMFPGQGSQYVNMGLDLYQTQPFFRQEINRCFDILKPIINDNIKQALYPAQPLTKVFGSPETFFQKGFWPPEAKIYQTQIAQPVLFIFEYALARLLMHWGIKPWAMIGHSIGEYVAACLAGVFSLRDALTLVALRGRSMQRMPGGAMLGVQLAEGALKPLLESNGQLSLAAVNGPAHCVVSGGYEAVETFERLLQEKGFRSRGLHTSHAFHSVMMEPVLAEFEKKARQIRFSQPQIPYISNLTGNWITPGEAVDPGYWTRHLRRTVRFSPGVQKLLNKKNLVFLETGPGKTLSTFVRQHGDSQHPPLAINLARHPREDTADDVFLWDKIGRMWLYGVSMDWDAYYAGETRYRLPLPSYPFEGQRFRARVDFHGIEVETLTQKSRFNKKKHLADFFYVPSWKPSVLGPGPPTKAFSKFLVFTCDGGWAGKLVDQLKEKGYEVILVEKGEEFCVVNDREYRIQPRRAEDYRALWHELDRRDAVPRSIVHLWGVTPESKEEFDNGEFYGLVYLVQALGRENITGDFAITAVFNHVREVIGGEFLNPGKSTLAAALHVIPQEFPNFRCRGIDIVEPVPGSRQEAELVNRLLMEISPGFTSHPDTVVAYRHNRRWVQTFEPVRLEKNDSLKSPFRQKGVYLITGGLGRIGLVLAQYLARAFQARLILTGRPGVPGEGRQEEKTRALQRVAETGGEVMVCRADAADFAQMQKIFTRAEERFGRINGVIHAAAVTTETSIRCPLENLTETLCCEQFHAKARGLTVLFKLLEDKEADFCLVMSSLAPVLGGLGFTAYSAANQFMDTFIKMRCREKPGAWFSVNWDAWQLGEEHPEQAAITPGEGEEALYRILAWGEEGRVVVSTRDLQARIQQWLHPHPQPPSTPMDDHVRKDAGPDRPRPHITSPYMAPHDPVEQALAKIWQKFLGFQQIGTADDFFELGGDSLKAMGLLSIIHKQLHVNIPLGEFFNKPFIKGLAGYITHAGKSEFLSLSPAEKQEYYPLSPAQKRIYILQQMEPDSRLFNLTQVSILEGALEKEKMERVFKQLIRRHESLRTSFHMIYKEPVQGIHDNVEFGIEYQSAPRPASFVRPFDLARAPLMRVGLAEWEGESSILMVDMHHIIHDGISQVIFLNDFTALYAGGSSTALKIQYKDYALRQQRGPGKAVIKEQEKYWLKCFKEGVPPLNLPYDYPRPALQNYDGKMARFTISTGETTALRKMALKEEVTLFMVLLAVFNVLLAKLSGQEDIVVGTPTAGRGHPDLDGIVGIFLNTLALRNFLIPGEAFRAFLKTLKVRTLEAFDNQDYPFEDLVDRAQVKRDFSRNPLFDVMFILHNQFQQRPGEIPPQSVEDLTLKPYPYEKNTSEFDITLVGFEEEDHLRFNIEYCTKLFKEETIQRFITYFKKIVDVVLKDPGLKISQIEIIPEQEKHRLLYEFNDTDTGYPKEKTIHRLFEEQAAKNPDAIAVNAQSAESMALSYNELNEKSNRLAYLLKTKAVTPGTIVGIMLERTAEMMVGLLGILKAGGAYLPIDPGFPEERIKYMLTDSSARILLTGRDFETPVSPVSPVAKKQPAASLAYVIYTSGSTGNPKGVAIEHRNAVNFIKGMTAKIEFAAGKSILAVTTISFDIFFLETLLPLACGHAMKVIMAHETQQRDPELLGRLIVRQRADMLQLTPSRLQMLLALNDNLTCLHGVETLMVGGEAFPVNLFSQVKEQFPGKIYNMYGPTETTIWSTLKDLTTTPPAELTIGNPIANTRVYIVDRSNCLQPVGAAGELLIGGDGVGRGYLNKIELTKIKFCLRRAGGSFEKPPPAPPQNFCLNNQKFLRGVQGGGFFKKSPPGRRRPRGAGSLLKLYQTGDLARWLVSGEIEFLGRIDSQVKIRGFRIELEEIAGQLSKHELIKEAVVAVKANKAAEMDLAAYVVWHGGNGKPAQELPGSTELREFLSRTLPGYMLPAYFVPLEKIPLTPNGKVNRKALPEPGADGSLSGATYVAPETGNEKIIAGIWKEVLQLEKPGIYDNFFDLGGNSLNLIQLNRKLKETFGRDIPVAVMFRNLTIDYLNRLLSRDRDDTGSAEEKETQRTGALDKARKTYKDTIGKLTRK